MGGKVKSHAGKMQGQHERVESRRQVCPYLSGLEVLSSWCLLHCVPQLWTEGNRLCATSCKTYSTDCRQQTLAVRLHA
jgi:hypothetical protein